MLVINENEAYVQNKLAHKYGKRVQVPEVEECYLNNNMMEERDSKKIEYDNQQMVEDLLELYKRGATGKVNVK